MGLLDLGISKEYDKYKKYVYNPMKPGIKSKRVNMCAEGWTMLIEEALCVLIEQELKLKYLGNRIWAGDYCDNRRMVFGLKLINESYATFKWGWNFDFVPVIKGKRTKADWARTDKSIAWHVCELPEDFILKTENRPNTAIDDMNFSIERFRKSIKDRIQSCQNAFLYVLPAVRDFYGRTSTYEEILQVIKEQQEHWYYGFSCPDLVISQIFIEYYLGDVETAKKHFSDLEFESQTLKESLYNKLLKVNNNKGGEGEKHGIIS